MGVRKHIPSGTTFERWTVLIEDGQRRYLCKCQCGRIKSVSATSLRAGSSKSCGCLQIEFVTNLKPSLSHGRRASRAYRTWQSMQTRCRADSSKYRRDYADRGISVCEKWKRFEGFYEDMGDPPDGYSLDRINNDGNYEPGNCRWATPTQQSRNKRDNRRFEFEGLRLLASEWAEIKGVPKNALITRLFSRKWPIEKALTHPFRKDRIE